MGLLHAIRIIYKSQGVRGLYQGHSMTLLRIFPYAGIKYMAYDALEGLLIPTPDKQTSGRLFLAGALSGSCLSVISPRRRGASTQFFTRSEMHTDVVNPR